MLKTIKSWFKKEPKIDKANVVATHLSKNSAKALAEIAEKKGIKLPKAEWVWIKDINFKGDPKWLEKYGVEQEMWVLNLFEKRKFDEPFFWAYSDKELAEMISPLKADLNIANHRNVVDAMASHLGVAMQRGEIKNPILQE